MKCTDPKCSHRACSEARVEAKRAARMASPFCRYLVISYDTDQQQFFHDYVLAKNANEAEEYVCAVRSYVVDADAIELAPLRHMAEELGSKPIADLDYDASVPLAECGDCGEKWPSDKLLPVEDIGQRVEPGEPMPAGECPSCRALCHLVPA